MPCAVHCSHAYDRYFYGRSGGTFVEVGAGRGTPQHSASFALEVDHGWRGVVVEAAVPLHRALVRHRPRATALLALVCAQEEGQVHFVYGGPEGAMSGGCRCLPRFGARIMMRACTKVRGEHACMQKQFCVLWPWRSGAIEFMSPLYAKTFHPNDSTTAAPIHSYPIACSPLSPLLDTVGVSHANFLSIDVVSTASKL